MAWSIDVQYRVISTSTDPCACSSSRSKMSSTPSRTSVALWLLFLVTLATGSLTTSAAAAATAATVDDAAQPAPRLMRTPSVSDPTLSSSSSSSSVKENISSSNSSMDGPPLPGDTLGTSTGSSSGSSGSAVAAFGSKLRPGEQCGGSGGICNSTTIGVPCGDHAWIGVTCPVYFHCARRNSSVWVCEPQTDSPLRQPMHQATANSTLQGPSAAGSTHVIAEDGQFTTAAAVGDGSSRNNRDSGGTVIRVCGPEQVARGLPGCDASVAPNGVVVLNDPNRSSAVSAAGRALLGHALFFLHSAAVCAVALV